MSNKEYDSGILVDKTKSDYETLESMSSDQLHTLISLIESLNSKGVGDDGKPEDERDEFNFVDSPQVPSRSDVDVLSNTQDDVTGGRDDTDGIAESDLILAAKDLEVSYGKVTALQGINLKVREGELVAIIGPNGAGKTTFVDTLTGYLDYQGTMRYRDHEVQDMRKQELVGTGMVYCSEERNLFGYMTVEDNLRLGAYRRGEDGIEENLAFVYDLFPRLENRNEQNARSMSGGEQQMLAIARALMGDPDLLILDEPTLGLAPVILEDISEALDLIKEEGVTILLTEQNVTFAFEHADRIYLLENGSIGQTGTPEELQGDNYIRESYLGG